MKGREEFKLVSPIFRKNIYVNSMDYMRQGETPIDFFDVDYKRFPLATKVNFISVTLSAGDCLYVPAYFYLQSKTLAASETILLTEQYESHSQFVDLLMDGLEYDIVEEEETLAIDQAILDRINNFTSKKVSLE